MERPYTQGISQEVRRQRPEQYLLLKAMGRPRNEHPNRSGSVKTERY